MITYLLKSIVCSGLLLGVYFLFLEKEKMHRFNRFYLLAAWLVSWLIPLITFKVQAPEAVEKVQQTILPATDNIAQHSTETLINTGVQQAHVNYFPIIFWCIYGMVTLILLIRFVMNMIQIRRQITKHGVQKSGNYLLVLIPDNEVSFSFFNYIFPAQDDYANGTMIFSCTKASMQRRSTVSIFYSLNCVNFFSGSTCLCFYTKEQYSSITNFLRTML